MPLDAHRRVAGSGRDVQELALSAPDVQDAACGSAQEAEVCSSGRANW
jgi:hypothetical protein